MRFLGGEWDKIGNFRWKKDVLYNYFAVAFFCRL